MKHCARAMSDEVLSILRKREGLFSNEHVRYVQYYTFGGAEADAGEFVSENRRKSTPVYCMHCGRKVTTMEKLMEEKK